MKMVDIGKKRDYGEAVAKSSKDKIYYPSLRIEKKIGDFEIGDEVNIVAKAKVSSLRSDEYGYSIEFQIKQIGVKEKTAKDAIDKAAESMLK